MLSRRSFVGSAVAATMVPAVSWAEVGSPTHLSAARNVAGQFELLGLQRTGDIAFKVPLPARGHAAAAHPNRAEAVAFARRPGTFALVIDCATGALLRRMDTPPGRHFYGHGAFSLDGLILLTTENDTETGEGCLGLWDVASGYVRLGEFPSNGIGPHEIVRLPGSDRFAVANGGIHTHPSSGREKLNLDTMRPNLTIVDLEGRVWDEAVLPLELHQNSLRHIAAFSDGRVACAFQWQGDPFDTPSITGLYKPGRGVSLVEMNGDLLHRLDGYAGSVAVLGPNRFGMTFPRGGICQTFDLDSAGSAAFQRDDICGIAPAAQGGLATDGLGQVHAISADRLEPLARHPVAFDNHLIAINPV